MNVTVCWCLLGELLTAIVLLLISLHIEWLEDCLRLVTVLFNGAVACGVLWPGISSAFSKSDELLLRDGWRKDIRGHFPTRFDDYLQCVC